MRRVLVIVFLIFCSFGFSQVREKFYIAEELFLSGEYIKARGIYPTLDFGRLSASERNIVNYRMAFFTNISNSLVFLSNSNLKESRELLEFIVAYLSGKYVSIQDVVNLGDEIDVYNYLDKVSNTGVFDVDFSLMLYFSLSNLRDRVKITPKNDFENLKFKFGEAIVRRNLGDDVGYNAIRDEILKNYPNSFWAKVLTRSGEKVQKDTELKLSLSPGFYVVISEKVDVIKEFLTLKNYKVFEVDRSIYVGPYYSQLEAQKDAEKFSKDYKVSVRVVQIRMQ